MNKVIVILIINLIILIPGFSQNNSLDYDGANDYVTMGDVLDIGLSNFTIEAWIFVEGTATKNKIINKGLTSVGTPTNSGYGLRTGMVSSDHINFSVVHSDGSVARAEATGLTTNTWHHLAGVRNGINITLYMDGVDVDNLTTSVVYNVDTNIPFSIGALHRGSFGNTTEVTDGKIDEVRIWNIARTQSEIQNSMNSQLNGNEPGLIAYYAFNQGIAGGNNGGVITLTDNTSNGNNGTLNNFTLSGNNSNWVGAAAPLPIELITFIGKSFNKKIHINWTTASEINNYGFEIQKSKHGRDWKSLDFIQGNGTSNIVNKYELLDLNPILGINYYRIKQIDFNGVFNYSKVISVKFKKDNEIDIYPNPTNGRLEIIGANIIGVKIRDNIGKTVKKLILINQSIDISGLSKGLYFISVETEKKVFTRRIIKE